MHLTRLAIFTLVATAFISSAEDAPTPAAAPVYHSQVIEGWTLKINERIEKEQKEKLDKALELITLQLKEIVRVVPEEAVSEMRKVTLWMNPEYEAGKARAEYHPDASWLRANGRNPAMAKGVEITNVRNFEAETKRMPCFILHELAHSYHDRFLTFKQPDILAAYKKAVANKSYDKVERSRGVAGAKNTIERAYAMTNEKEYFAETTEAFFACNDFFPFTRDELEKHDPDMVKALQQVWKAK